MRQFVVSLVLALALIGSAAAGIIDSVRVERSWQDPWGAARARLFFTVTDSAGQEDVVYLYVTLRLEDPAELRYGEVEEWRVRGQIFASSTGSHRVWVDVDPVVAYHDYPSVRGNVFVHSTINYANARFGHGGRVETGAPATVDQGDVDYSSVDAPVHLRFRDFAFEENGAAPTEYSFAFYRRRMWGDEPLVARGTFPHATNELQSVSIEPEGEYAAQGDEWFREGKSYWVVIRVKRSGTAWYTDEFGASFLGVFEWSSEEGATLRAADPAERRDATAPVEARLFRRLHP